MIFTRLLRKPPAPAPAPAIERRRHALPDGERIYAIGDIHGRADCLEALIAAIASDEQARPSAETTLVFLGDLVDRGPESRRVIERLMALAQERRCLFLGGNHEEVLIRAWDGDARAAAMLDRIGGRETLLSYGVDPDVYDLAGNEERGVLALTHIPAGHIDFLRAFHDWFACGSYLFVHAGIRPGVAVQEQAQADLRWIRREFLEDSRDHGVMVVHGHSIVPDVEILPNRIGIDTGAYATGCLTAIGLERDCRWFLSTAPAHADAV